MVPRLALSGLLAFVGLALPTPVAAFGAERLAQLDRPAGRPPVMREMQEHDIARSRHEEREMRGFDELLRRAHTAVRPAQYIGVEPDLRQSSYRFKFLKPDGKVVWVDVDGRTGAVLSIH